MDDESKQLLLRLCVAVESIDSRLQNVESGLDDVKKAVMSSRAWGAGASRQRSRGIGPTQQRSRSPGGGEMPKARVAVGQQGNNQTPHGSEMSKMIRTPHGFVW